MHKQPLLVSEELRSVTGGTSLSCLFYFLHAVHSWLWPQWAHGLSQCSCSTVLKIKGPEKVFEAKPCQMREQGCTDVLLNGLFCVFSTLRRKEWRIYRSVVCCVLTAVPTTLIKTIKPNWVKWLIITLQLTELVTTAPRSSSMKEPRTSEQACFCSLRQAFQTSEAWNSSTLHEWLQQGELSCFTANNWTLPDSSVHWSAFPHLSDPLFHSPGYSQNPWIPWWQDFAEVVGSVDTKLNVKILGSMGGCDHLPMAPSSACIELYFTVIILVLT